MPKYSVYVRSSEEETPFETWLRLTDEKKQLALVLERELPKTGLTQSPGKKQILDVGCSDGGTGGRIMEIIDGMGVPFHYHALDPVPSQLEKFMQRLNGEELERVSFIQQDFEHFDYDGMFDFSIAIHSLHYVVDLVGALKKLLKMSKEGVVVHHGRGGVTKFHSRYRDYVDVGPHAGLSYEDMMRLLEDADTEKIYKKRMVVYEGTTNFDDCGNRDSCDARNLVSFLFGKPYEQIPGGVADDAHRFLAAEYPKILAENLGAVFFSIDHPTG